MLTNEQKSVRMNGLGASDSPIIMGFSSYKTPYELYLEKTGQKEADDTETEQQYWGNRLESIILNEFEKRNNVELINPDTIHHPQYDFIFANLDGYEPKEKMVVEAKNSNAFMKAEWDAALEDGIPMQYLIQIAKQVACADAIGGYCAVLIGGCEFRQYKYMRDRELEDMIIKSDIAFWDCLQNGIPPEPTKVSDLRLMYPGSNVKSVVANDESKRMIELIKRHKKILDDCQKDNENFKMTVMEYMKDNELLVDEYGKTLVSWKSGKRGRTFLIK